VFCAVEFNYYLLVVNFYQHIGFVIPGKNILSCLVIFMYA
jgi:hypothetical protein